VADKRVEREPISLLHVIPSINPRTEDVASVPAGEALAKAGVGMTIASLDHEEHGAAADVPGAVCVPPPIRPRLRGWSPALRRCSSTPRKRPTSFTVTPLMVSNLRPTSGGAVRAGCYLAARHADPWSLERSRFKKRLAAWVTEPTSTPRAFCTPPAISRPSRSGDTVCASRLRFCRTVDLPRASEVLQRDPERRFQELRGKRWLLFLGRLDPKKGPDLLLENWASWGPAILTGVWSSPVPISRRGEAET
jgi:hypothetical protein